MEDFAVEAVATPEIPNKLYFRIGEVARIAGIKPYVLRFWESEFSRLGPKKSGTGHRLYRRKDVEMVLEIKRLLYDRRFTIAGARQFLEDAKKRDGQQAPLQPLAQQTELFSPLPSLVQDLRKDLREILALLDQKVKSKSQTA